MSTYVDVRGLDFATDGEDSVDDREAVPEARAVGDRQAEPDDVDASRRQLVRDAVDAAPVLRVPRRAAERPDRLPFGHAGEVVVSVVGAEREHRHLGASWRAATGMRRNQL